MDTPHGPYIHQAVAETDAAVQRADDEFIATHQGEACKMCTSGPLIDFSMAFQPIVDVQSRTTIAYEALTRGPAGEPAASILNSSMHNNQYAMDQRCREKAIAVSAALGILATGADLSINFFPNAVYEPKQCLRRTINAAEIVNFPLNRIIFEITEVEKVRSKDHLRNIMREYQASGLRIAIDDFGEGYAGLSLLSVFQPDIIKIDRALIERIDQRPPCRSIVKSIVQVCGDLDILVIAEGIERREEMQVVCDLGITRMQGFFFACPELEALPVWPPEAA